MNTYLTALGLFAVLLAVILPNPKLVNGPVLDKTPLGVIEPEHVKRAVAMIWDADIDVPWNETRDMTITEATIKCAEIGWEYSGHRPFAKNTNGTITVKYDIHCVQWRTEFV